MEVKQSPTSSTDYDTIAERYAAEIDVRPWNALYERPTTIWRCCRMLPAETYSMPDAVPGGIRSS